LSQTRLQELISYISTINDYASEQPTVFIALVIDVSELDPNFLPLNDPPKRTRSLVKARFTSFRRVDPK
jgi:hypothetical protein